MNAYCLSVFEFVLHLQENPLDLHNLLLPPILKNLLIVYSTVGHCTRDPHTCLLPKNIRAELWLIEK